MIYRNGEPIDYKTRLKAVSELFPGFFEKKKPVNLFRPVHMIKKTAARQSATEVSVPKDILPPAVYVNAAYRVIENNQMVEYRYAEKTGVDKAGNKTFAPQHLRLKHQETLVYGRDDEKLVFLAFHPEIKGSACPVENRAAIQHLEFATPEINAKASLNRDKLLVRVKALIIDDEAGADSAVVESIAQALNIITTNLDDAEIRSEVSRRVEKDVSTLKDVSDMLGDESLIKSRLKIRTAVDRGVVHFVKPQSSWYFSDTNERICSVNLEFRTRPQEYLVKFLKENEEMFRKVTALIDEKTTMKEVLSSKESPLDELGTILDYKAADVALLRKKLKDLDAPQLKKFFAEAKGLWQTRLKEEYLRD